MKNLSSQTNYPFIVSVISTKGGVTKSTNVANVGAFCADYGCNGSLPCNILKTSLYTSP